MNILRLIAKEFKLNVRSYKANIMMVLFPIVLILILGAAFSGQFDSTITLGDMKVLYTEDVGESRHYLTDAFKEFRESLTREYGLVFEKTDDADAGMESVKGYKYAGYIQVSDEMGEIRFYNNEKHGGYKSVILESALSSFIKTYGAMETIAANKPEALGMPQMQGRGEYVSLKSLNQKQQPGSLDYYAVTMMTMILLYASLTGLWSVREDITQMTAGRILCAPVKRYEFLTGKWVLKANWGSDLISVLLLLTTYSIMAVSLGVGLAYLFQKADAANGLLNTIIPVVVFLGGGYVPLSEMGSVFNGISNISPVKWANTALFRLIYDQDYSQFATSVLINLSAAAVFILISALFSRKGAGKYA
jgi:ABC-2 type transport system permease protein